MNEIALICRFFKTIDFFEIRNQLDIIENT